MNKKKAPYASCWKWDWLNKKKNFVKKFDESVLKEIERERESKKK